MVLRKSRRARLLKARRNAQRSTGKFEIVSLNHLYYSFSRFHVAIIVKITSSSLLGWKWGHLVLKECKPRVWVGGCQLQWEVSYNSCLRSACKMCISYVHFRFFCSHLTLGLGVSPAAVWFQWWAKAYGLSLHLHHVPLPCHPRAFLRTWFTETSQDIFVKSVYVRRFTHRGIQELADTFPSIPPLHG